MNRGLIVICLVGVAGLFLVFGPMRIKVSGLEGARINAAADVLLKAIDNPEGRIPESVLEQAAAIAVVPDVFHGSILYERGYGDGIVIARTEEGAWSNPSFVKFLSIGSKEDNLKLDNVILVFNDRKSVELFKRGRFVLGRDISIAVGPVTNRTEKKAEGRDQVGVYSYALMDGRPTGVAIGSIVLQVNDWANKSFYNSRGATFETLMAKESPMGVPLVANRFKCVVVAYGSAGQTC